MKIFIVYARENWITDELAKEWIQNNKELYTNNPLDADIIWILSNYVIQQLPYYIYKQKKVVCTIHHIVPSKVNQEKIKHFKILNQITDLFLTNQNICKKELEKYVSKPIKVVPLWNNENVWKNIEKKEELRKKYNFSENDFLIGSFQKDTEGGSIKDKTYKPKLEKGPDLFVKAVTLLKKEKYPNLKVVLTGYYRQYIINELKKNNIDFYFFEKVDFKTLNELMNCLDLYIVASRFEGGPRAINECSLTKTPILSTNVGIASLLCYPDSIFDMNNIKTILNCKYDIEYNFKQAQKYTIKKYMKDFTNQLTNL
tara:strand:- start:1553 stop:2491 length:939 start_codon:yes stop_codon:yes gene_type:complete